ncbi:hypothetical protein YC2023_043186 [Brassica napus]
MTGTRLPDERAQAVRSLGSLLNYVRFDPRKGDELRRTDAGRLLSGRRAEDDRELLLVADVVASGRDRDLSWTQAELRMRTLDTNRERLKLSLIGVETRQRSSRIATAGFGRTTSYRFIFLKSFLNLSPTIFLQYELHSCKEVELADNAPPPFKCSCSVFRRPDKLMGVDMFLLDSHPKSSDFCSVFLPLNIHGLSSLCMQSIVRGVMSYDVSRLLNHAHHYSVVGCGHTWLISAENI